VSSSAVSRIFSYQLFLCHASLDRGHFVSVLSFSGFPRLLENPGKSWIFISKNSSTWKVLENEFGTGKSWKLNFKVLKSPGIYLWLKVTAGTEKLFSVHNTMCK